MESNRALALRVAVSTIPVLVVTELVMWLALHRPWPSLVLAAVITVVVSVGTYRHYRL